MSMPTEQRPIRMDPDLFKAVEGLLKAYKGEALERAQEAVRSVKESGHQGQFSELLAKYRDAIEEAAKA